MNRQTLIFVAPVMSLILLGGMVAENRVRLRPEDTDNYHTLAKAAVESIRPVIGDWCGEDRTSQIPNSAFQLLKPNILFSRRYVKHVPGTTSDRIAVLMVTQCRYASDMAGHWPKICYPANGQRLVREEPRVWKFPDLTLEGTEFEFSDVHGGTTYSQVVYNFLIVPHKGVVREMKQVYKAAEDYQRRYYGAAQFQLIVNGAYSQQERDEIFNELIGPNTPVIRTLIDEGNTP